MVIVDALEDYVPGEDKEDYDRAQWKGNFVSLDLSDLRGLGVEPVVYYYTGDDAHEEVAGLNTKSDTVKNGAIDKIEASQAWSTELPADPADVTAFAIDARHMSDGTDFKLKELEAFSIFVRMQAKVYDTAGEEGDPFNADEELRKDPDNNDHAFNDAFLDCTQIDPIGQETYAYIQHEYVRVGIIPFELKVRKIWDDANNNDGRRPNSITVHMLANGKRLVPDKTLTLDDSNGWVDKITHLIRYDEDGNWITYTFEEDTEDERYQATFGEDYALSIERVDNDVTLTNTHVPEVTGIGFEKKWVHDNDEDRSHMPASIEVRLMSDESGTGSGEFTFTGKTLTVKPDSSGNWKGSFKDLPKYTNPSGVSGDQKMIRYAVEETPVYMYLTEYAAENDGNTLITNTFYPFGDLLVKKKVQDNATAEAKKKEFPFTLVLKDRDGEDLTEEYNFIKSDADGNELDSGKIGNGGRFTLKGDEQFLIKDIPSESSYEVVEGETAGFELVGSSGTVSSIRAGATKTADFTNRYAASGKQSLALTKTLTGRQMTKNQFWFELVDLNDGSPTQYEVIRTTAADAAGSAAFSDLKYTEADDGKTFVYAIRELDREKPGYTYDDATYLVEVKVEDLDGNGKLTCTPKYYTAQAEDKTVFVEVLDEDTGDTVQVEKQVTDYSAGSEVTAADITFANEYHASGTTRLNAWKQLPGGTFEVGDFYFLLFDYTPGSYNFGLPILDSLNDDKGRVVFEDSPGTADERKKLRYTENDAGKTFFYVAKEMPGNDPAINYDGAPRGYEVSVADNGNGTLAITTVNVKVEGEDGTYFSGGSTADLPVFVNHLKPGNLELTKFTTWDTEGREPDGSMDFSFKLTFSEMEGIEMPTEIKVHKEKVTQGQQAYSAGNEPADPTAAELAGYTVELDDSHSYAFTLKAGQKLCVEDLPGGLAYQFQEEIPSGWTLTFDSVAGVVNPNNTTSARYTNNYEPGVAVATFIAGKKMDGRVPEPFRFAFELVDDTEGSATKGQVLQTLPNQASGYVLFDEKYQQAGTYKYIIREVQDKLVAYVDHDGKVVYEDTTSAQAQENLRKVIFDPTEYHVTVEVTEEQHGGETTLSAKVSYEEEKVQFNNASRPGSLQIRKVPEGLTEANKDSEFTFKVKLTNEAGMPMTESGNMFWYADEDPDAVAPEETPAYGGQDPAGQDPDADGNNNGTAGPGTNADGNANDPANPGTDAGGDAGGPILQGKIPGGIMNAFITGPLNAGGVLMLAEEPSRAGGSGDSYHIAPTVDTVTASGLVNDGTNEKTVKWTLYTDGTLILEPVDGVSGYINVTSSTGYIDGSVYPWHSYRSSIKRISSRGTIHVRNSLSSMFRQCRNLTEAELPGFDVSNVTSIRSLFYECTSLEYVDISSFHTTSTLRVMDWFVAWCDNLKYVNIANITNANATMDSSFNRSTSIVAITVGPNFKFKTSQFDTSHTWYRIDNPEPASPIRVSAMVSRTGTALEGTWVRSGSEGLFHATIRFNNNGGTGTMDDFDWSFTNQTLPACEFMSDLNFIGWGLKPDDVEPTYQDGETVTSLAGAGIGGTVTLYALWASEDSFLINYDAATNGGYVSRQWQRVNGAADTVELPTPTHPSNYEFLGWNTEADGTGTTYTGTVTGADLNTAAGATLVLYAQFLDPSKRTYLTVEHYQETPEGSGSYGTAYETDRKIFNINEEVTEEDAPAHSYRGFKEGVMNPVVTFPQNMPQGGITVKYYYDRTRYTIVYDPNGGEGEMADSEMIGGVGMKLPVSKFTKENCLFVGWNTLQDGSGTNYGDGQTVNSIGDDGETVTLYAQWYNMDDAESAEATNGEYTVHCKAGEIIVFPQVPAGTQYEIVETDLPDGWKLKSLEPANGDVKSAERVEITAVNSYSAKGSADVMAHKRLPGETIESGAFRFQLIDMNGAAPKVLETVANAAMDEAEQIADPDSDDGSTIDNPWLGTAPVRFELLEFEKQGVYTYKIKELPGQDSSIRYDSHEETVTILVKDRGDGRLTTEVFYEDGNAAVFTNEMSDGELKVSKTIRNATEKSKDAEFIFTVYLYDSKGNELREEYTVEMPDGTETTVKSGGNVTIKGGESFTVKGLPHKSTYLVTEAAARGFELVSAVDSNGTVQAGETAEASFTNAYTITTRGLAVIRAQKQLSGRDIQDGEFIFRLLNDSGETLDETTADTDGQVQFNGLSYGLEDDKQRYIYYVEEVPGRYMTKEEAEAAGIEVTEDMRVKAEEAAGAAGEGQEAQPADGQEAGNEAAGTAGTDAGQEAQPAEGQEDTGEALYLVPDPDMIYDGHRVQVAVEISDNGDGSMTADVIYPEDGAVFENFINHGALKIRKTVANVTERNIETEFRFTVNLKDPEGNAVKGTFDVEYYDEADGTAGADGTEGAEGTAGADGTAANGGAIESTGTIENGGTIVLKHGKSAVIRRLPYLTEYEVIEEAAENFEITDKQGDTGTIGANTTSEASFENTDIKPYGLVLKAAKQLKNGRLEAGKFSFELVDMTVDSKTYGEVIDTAKASAEGNVTFKSIDYAKDDVGKTFTYVIREVKGEDPLMVYDGHEETVEVTVALDEEDLITAEASYDADGAVFVNEKQDELIDINVTKVWDDGYDQDKLRPDRITVTLLADGKEVQTAGFGAAEKWKYTFTELPKMHRLTKEEQKAAAEEAGKDTTKEAEWYDEFAEREIVYEIAELKVKEYKTSIQGDAAAGFTITNTHEPMVYIDIDVTKLWDDEENKDQLRPDKIIVTLLADGKEVKTAEFAAGESGWKYTFTNLPKTRKLTAEEKKAMDEAGEAYDELTEKEIVYEIAELQVKDYKASIEGDAAAGFTITNTHEPMTYIDIDVTKVWEDEEDKDKLRPAKITVRLMADGTETKTAEFGAADGWNYTFTNLPKTRKLTAEEKKAMDEAGEAYDELTMKDIVYEIKEVNVKNYISEIEGTAEGGYTITNKRVPKKLIDIDVTKVWEDYDDKDGVRPKSITVRLLADGKEVKSHLLRASEDWKYTFTDLPESRKADETAAEAVAKALDKADAEYVNAEKVEIAYTVEEDKVREYDTVIEGDAAAGFVITNSHELKPIDITVSKIWDDEDNRLKKRPEVITVHLLADGKEKAQKVLVKDNGWKESFRNLPQVDKETGEEILYTLKEDVPEGYSGVVSGDAAEGFRVTNTVITPGRRGGGGGTPHWPGFPVTPTESGVLGESRLPDFIRSVLGDYRTPQGVLGAARMGDDAAVAFAGSAMLLALLGMLLLLFKRRRKEER